MKDIWKILMIVSALLSCSILILCLVRGECGGVIDCGSTTVPMKCHWAFIAAACLAFMSLLFSVLGIFFNRTKDVRVVISLGILTILILLLLALYSFIGVCAKDTMACIGNRFIVTIVVFVNLFIGLVSLAKSNPGTVSIPKQRL